MEHLTIKRADLVEIATRALSETEGLTEQQHLDLCETAHTMDSVLVSSWITPECGCLVGTLYRSEFVTGKVTGTDARPQANFESHIKKTQGDAVIKLGLRFDTHLMQNLKDQHGDDAFYGRTSNIIKVVD